MSWSATIVVTSGIDGIYPKGFVIGSVDGVEQSGGAYKRITVRPAVDFARARRSARRADADPRA